MMHRTAEFLRNCHTFYVATVEGNQPRVRPFGAIDEFEGRLYLVTSNQKPVFAQLTQNPRLEICAMNDGGQWIRIEALAVKDDRAEAREHMLEANPGLKKMYGVDDGIMEVLYLDSAVVHICSFTAPTEILRF